MSASQTTCIESIAGDVPMEKAEATSERGRQAAVDSELRLHEGQRAKARVQILGCDGWGWERGGTSTSTRDATQDDDDVAKGRGLRACDLLRLFVHIYISALRRIVTQTPSSPASIPQRPTSNMAGSPPSASTPLPCPISPSKQCHGSLPPPHRKTSSWKR